MVKLTDEWYKYCNPERVKESKWVELLPKNKLPTSDKIIQNIYYVNGVFNKIDKAQEYAKALQTQLNKGQKLKDAKVRLLYNKYEGPTADLVECMLDKTWTYGKPILNPTTIAVIALLYYAKAKKKEIAIVGHSQGTLIVYNAVAAFRKQSKSNEEFLKKTPIFLCAPMIHALLERRLAKWTKYTPIKNPKDWLPPIIAGDIGTALTNLIDASINRHISDKRLAFSTKATAKIRKKIIDTIAKSRTYQNSAAKKKMDKETKRGRSRESLAEHRFYPVYSSQFNREMFEDKNKSTKMTSKKATTFRILALGDSVVWGQGLKPKNKFVHLVGEEISKKTNENVVVTLLAHSGATIEKKKGATPYKSYRLFPYGEIPRDRPNLYTQLRISQLNENYTGYLDEKEYDTETARQYRSKLRAQLALYKREHPDLIILDGGANDIGLYQIMSPINLKKINKNNITKLSVVIAKVFGKIPSVDTLTDKDLMKIAKKYRQYVFLKQDLEKMVKQYCYKDMLDLISEVRKAYPYSKILVTGYYPVFTRGTLKKATIQAIAALILYVLFPISAAGMSAKIVKKHLALILAILLLFSRQFFINRAITFSNLSEKYLKGAVSESNKRLGTSMVFFAAPNFDDENGMFAKNSYVWPLTFTKPKARDLSTTIRSIDDVRATRLKAVNKFFSYIDKEPEIGDRESGIAHPNNEGAQEFCKAIMKVINKNGILKKAEKKEIKKKARRGGAKKN